MRHFLRLLFAAILLPWHAWGQNYPVYNHFFINPYLYNPAEVLSENSQLYLLNRQQWTNVEGAPTLSALTFNTLIKDTRSGVGVKFSSYKRGLLNTSDFGFTYGYGLPLGENNWLSLGITAGAISNQIDINKVTNPNDPAIQNYLANNLQLAGSAGLLFRSGKGFRMGIALPQLFTPAYNAPENFNTTGLSPLDKITVTMGYQRPLFRAKKEKTKIVMVENKPSKLEGFLVFKYEKTGQHQLEALLRANLTENFWVGASYRLPYGLTGNLGFRYKQFLVGYSYEPGSQPETGFSQGSHEIIVGLRLGKPKQLSRIAPNLRSRLKEIPKVQLQTRFKETRLDIEKEIRLAPPPLKKRFLVVIKVFTDFRLADEFKVTLRKELYNAEVYFNRRDNRYYVYTLEVEDEQEAEDEVKNLKNFTDYKNAKVLILPATK